MPRKIKNPEKYIEKLKTRIKWLEGVAGLEAKRSEREIGKYKGECKVNWENGIIDEQEALDFSLGVFNPGDLIVVTGVVIEVHKEGSDSSLKFERKQTKLVQAIE